MGILEDVIVQTHYPTAVARCLCLLHKVRLMSPAEDNGRCVGKNRRCKRAGQTIEYTEKSNVTNQPRQ